VTDVLTEFVVVLIGAIVIVAIGAVAGYFILRRLFERASHRVADDIGRVLADLSVRAAATPVGKRTTTAARAASGRYTNLGAYAAAQGISEQEARRQFSASIERTARIMDSAVKLPVIGPVGLDAVLGLLPVAGDTVAAAIAISLIAKSIRYGIPREIVARMLANVLFDLLLGAIPVAGDIADMWFRANSRNVALLREYLGDEARNTIEITATRVS
jgi:hypothetical protein